jgi:hypothetical protein
MHMVNKHALTDLLLQTERQMDELGWDQPSVLFALHGPIEQPRLEYAVQLPGGAAELLGSMISSGMSARGDVLGLVLAANSPHPLDVDDWLAMPVRSSSFIGPSEECETRLMAPRNGAGVHRRSRVRLAGACRHRGAAGLSRSIRGCSTAGGRVTGGVTHPRPRGRITPRSPACSLRLLPGSGPRAESSQIEDVLTA